MSVVTWNLSFPYLERLIARSKRLPHLFEEAHRALHCFSQSLEQGDFHLILSYGQLALALYRQLESYIQARAYDHVMVGWNYADLTMLNTLQQQLLTLLYRWQQRWSTLEVWPLDAHFIPPLRDWASNPLDAAQADVSLQALRAEQQVYRDYVRAWSFAFACDQELTISDIHSLVLSTNHKVRQAARMQWVLTLDGLQKTFLPLLTDAVRAKKIRGMDADFWSASFREKRFSNSAFAAFWKGMHQCRGRLWRFYSLKARYLGLKQFGWADCTAPFHQMLEPFLLDDAVTLYRKSWEQTCPVLWKTVCHFFKQGWIDTKMGGEKGLESLTIAYPLERQVRGSIHFTGTYHDILELSDVLGRLYAQYHLLQQPQLQQRASDAYFFFVGALAEEFVCRYAQKSLWNRQERFVILGEGLNRHLFHLFDAMSLAYFEKKVIAMPCDSLTVDRLREEMLRAQRVCFGPGLHDYEPSRWVSHQRLYTPRYVSGYWTEAVGRVAAWSISVGKSDAALGQLLEKVVFSENVYLPFCQFLQTLGYDAQSDTFWEHGSKGLIERLDHFETLLKAKDRVFQYGMKTFRSVDTIKE